MKLFDYHHITVSEMSQVKRYIKENNNLFTLSALKELTYKDFDQVTPEQWKKYFIFITSVESLRSDIGTNTAYKKKASMHLLFTLVVRMMRHPVKVASSVKRVEVRVINTINFCCYMYLNNKKYYNII